MLVERTCEVALEQLIVVDSLSDNTANEFEVAKVIGIDVRVRLDLIDETVARRGSEERVPRSENFSQNYVIPVVQRPKQFRKDGK